MTVSAARRKSLTRTIDNEGWTTYVANYDVDVTNPEESLDDVSVAFGIPFWGDSLSFGSTVNSNASCIGKSVSYTDQDGTNLRRAVTCTFSTKPRSKEREVTNPLDDPWKMGGSFAVGTRVTGIDKDGAPIYTTGKERKYFEVPDGYDTLQLEGPSFVMSLSQRAQCVTRCNSATIWGLTLRQVYMAQWQWQKLFFSQSDSYFYHRLEFWIKYAGWNEVWLNEGTQEYISGNAEGEKIRPIIAGNDAGGRNFRFLGASGTLLADADVPSGIITNTTKVIPEFDFTVLSASIGLPNPLPGNFV